jgi:hypothetical protein
MSSKVVLVPTWCLLLLMAWLLDLMLAGGYPVHLFGYLIRL